MNFRMPEILEGMSLYLESLQLLALTIRDITLYTIKSCSGEEQERLTEKFDLLRQETRCIFVLNCTLNGLSTSALW